MTKPNFTLLIIALSIIVTLGACKKDPFASVSINAVGSDLGGDVTGDGGSVTNVFDWSNPSTTSNWNMDITAVSGGSFQLIIQDAGGNTVADKTLTAGIGDDSGSGVTSAGTSGNWTITVVLTNFNGDGSFSISPGT